MNQYQHALRAIQSTPKGFFYNYELMIMKRSLEELVAVTITFERDFKNWLSLGDKISWPEEDPLSEWAKPDSFQVKLKDQ